MHWDTCKQDNYSTVGVEGDVGLARYKPAQLPPCLTNVTIWVLSYSSYQEIHSLHF